MTAAIVFSAIGLLCQGLCTLFEQKGIYNRSLPLKLFASTMFFMVGFTGFLIGSFEVYNLFIVLGLLFGVIGDFFLSYSNQVNRNLKTKYYSVGIIAFLIGHLLYLVALLITTKNILISFVVGLVLSVLLIVFILQKRKFDKFIKIFGIVYVYVLINMMTFSVFNFIGSYSTKSLLFMIGGILFLVSDMVIIINTFGKKKNKLVSAINLYVYFIAQLLIAFTTLI